MENILTSSCESQLVNDSVENTNTLNNENNSNQDKINDSGSGKLFSNSKRFVPEDYVSLMEIGRGNYSSIFLVEEKKSKLLCAMKIYMKMRVENLRKKGEVLMEKHVLEKISPHKYIINFIGSNKDEACLYMLYEYINGGELWQQCRVYGISNVSLIKYYFKQIVEAVIHMHSYNIVHRDLKPENIMITKDKLHAKIIDFASCYDLDGTEFEKILEKENQNNRSQRKKQDFKYFVGTPNYMPVESVRNRGVSKATDMWSLGCILYQLFVGFPPFIGGSEYLIFQKSIEANYYFPKGIVEEDAKNLIENLIKINPEERLNIKQVYEHPFLKEISIKYPIPSLREASFENIKTALIKKYEKDGKISIKVKEIEENLKLNKEKLEEISTSNEKSDITPEKLKDSFEKTELELTELKEKLLKTKSNFDNEFEEISGNFKNSDLLDTFKKELIINKLNHLRKQIYHDIFNILFEY